TVSNAIPVISFVTPTNGAAFTAPANVSVAVSASAASGIAKVTVYSGDHVLATFTNTPYSLVLSNLAAGRYELSARATDLLGLVASAQVEFSVANVAPQVTLTSPTNSAVF